MAHSTLQSSVASPVLHRAHLPSNIYIPFTIQYFPSRYATFLPQVLWAEHSYQHKAILTAELNAIRSRRFIQNLNHPTSGLGNPQPHPQSISRIPALITYKPTTPYIFHFARTNQLPPHDILYYMEVFFGNAMIDRAGVLSRCASIRILDPIPPMRPFNKPISQICVEQARRIFNRAAKSRRFVKVLWSGGIDSTTALVALLRAGTPVELQNLVVMLTQQSIAEYQLFYEHFIRNKIRTEEVVDMGRIYSKVPGEGDFILVTGELGDQIFGSMYMEFFFTPPVSSLGENVFSGNLETPWTEFMPHMLEQYGAIPPEAGADWVRWIYAQVSRSPIPIISTFDFLWWMNFSLKWQHVVLRIIEAQAAVNDQMLEQTEHFFRNEEFQQWSFHNHKGGKLLDRRYWTTYKGVLKNFIYEFTNDENYRVSKTKERSLRLIGSAGSWEPQKSIGLDENFARVTFGTQAICLDSFKERYGDSLGVGDELEFSAADQQARSNVWFAASSEKVIRNAFLSKTKRLKAFLKRKKHVMPSLDERSMHALQAWVFSHKKSKVPGKRHNKQLEGIGPRLFKTGKGE